MQNPNKYNPEYLEKQLLKLDDHIKNGALLMSNSDTSLTELIDIHGITFASGASLFDILNKIS